MLSFEEICRAHTLLCDNDIDFLADIERSLVYSADLGSGDVFLDCYDKTGASAVVVAHARPQWSPSLYRGNVVGEKAERDNEPAVYHSLETGVPAHDLKAVTQEGRAVKQDVVPVQNSAGYVIAVLIREKDVSERLVKDKKFDFLAGEHDKTASAAFLGETYEIALREAHHRIKNNLQLIVSIMRMQARNTKSEEVRTAFNLNTQRVLTIASIHDILTNTNILETVELKSLIARISREIASLFEGSRKAGIAVTGDQVEVGADTAASVAIVVNELITNAMQHGYRADTEGTVMVSVQKGNRFVTVSVEDDGRGFDTTKSNMGLAIVPLMVKDKLHGDFRIKSDSGGTKAAFDFQIKG